MNANVIRNSRENSANYKITWSDLKEIKRSLVRTVEVKMAAKSNKGETATVQTEEKGKIKPIRNARNRGIAIITSKNMDVAPKNLIKWPNAWPQMEAQTLVVPLRLKPGKSDLFVPTVPLPEKKWKWSKDADEKRNLG